MKRVRTEEFFSDETRFYIDLPLQRTTSYKVLKKRKGACRANTQEKCNYFLTTSEN